MTSKAASRSRSGWSIIKLSSISRLFLIDALNRVANWASRQAPSSSEFSLIPILTNELYAYTADVSVRIEIPDGLMRIRHYQPSAASIGSLISSTLSFSFSNWTKFLRNFFTFPTFARCTSLSMFSLIEKFRSYMFSYASCISKAACVNLLWEVILSR